MKRLILKWTHLFILFLIATRRQLNFGHKYKWNTSRTRLEQQSDNSSLHRAVIRYRCDQIGTPVMIKDPEDVAKSMISGHFNRDAATTFSLLLFCCLQYATLLLWDWNLSFLVHFYIFLPWYKIERKYSYNKPLLVIEHGTQRRVNHISLVLVFF